MNDFFTMEFFASQPRKWAERCLRGITELAHPRCGLAPGLRSGGSGRVEAEIQSLEKRITFLACARQGSTMALPFLFPIIAAKWTLSANSAKCLIVEDMIYIAKACQ